jgi:hypothetical protein
MNESTKGDRRVMVAGEDRTAELPGVVVPVAAAVRPLALELAEARSEEEYLSLLIGQLRTQGAIRVERFETPRQAGLMGRLMTPVRRLLWKLLRHQHEAMAFQQNAVNAQVAAGLEFIREEYRKRLDRLEARMAALEKPGGPGAP